MMLNLNGGCYRNCDGQLKLVMSELLKEVPCQHDKRGRVQQRELLRKQMLCYFVMVTMRVRTPVLLKASALLKASSGSCSDSPPTSSSQLRNSVA